MIKKVKLLIIAAGILLAGCFEPEIVPPLTFDGEANMTIAEFCQLHKLSTDYPPTLIDTNAIITGIVISTDQYGSCYKEIFIQDETGGISIRTSNSAYYNKYPIGQRIFVKAKGLYLGNYISGGNYGYYQLGLYGNGRLEYLSAQSESQHLFRSGVPESLPKPKEIRKVSDIDAEVGGDYHTLVKLVNCHFKEAKNGTKYYEERFVLGGAANQPIVLSSGGEIVARISAFNTFKDDVLPEGVLNITGILTKFGATPQFIICSVDDIETPSPVRILKSYDMSTTPFNAGWSNKQVKGEAVWTYSTGSQNNVRIQAENETECWFVSPKLGFAGEKDVTLYFSYRMINGGTNDNFKVKCTVDGSNWNDFALELVGNTEATLKLPGDIASDPNLQIAFQYKTTNAFPMWAIHKIEFRAE
jgi:hypothetical protein